jgi:hypothetical protein
MPAALLLEQFAKAVCDAFGEIPYQVGSSLQTTAWRDVDVRLILSDEAYEAWGFGNPDRTHEEPKWVAFTLAFSALGKAMTGLPIDFQIQQQTHANKSYEGGRSALGILRELRESRRRRAATEAPDA